MVQKKDTALVIVKPASYTLLPKKVSLHFTHLIQRNYWSESV